MVPELEPSPLIDTEDKNILDIIRENHYLHGAIVILYLVTLSPVYLFLH